MGRGEWFVFACRKTLEARSLFKSGEKDIFPFRPFQHRVVAATNESIQCRRLQCAARAMLLASRFSFSLAAFGIVAKPAQPLHFSGLLLLREGEREQNERKRFSSFPLLATGSGRFTMQYSKKILFEALDSSLLLV